MEFRSNMLHILRPIIVSKETSKHCLFVHINKAKNVTADYRQ